MKSKILTFVSMLAGGVFLMYPAQAQDLPLHEVLYRTVCERIGGPMVFSTRDTLFALSLPTDEPATVYLQLTVSRNGRIKEKRTKVHANHLSEYVTPVFKAATEKLRVDRTLVDNKDTSLLVAFPLEYQCVRDTTVQASRANVHLYRSRLFEDKVLTTWWNENKNSMGSTPSAAQINGFFLDNPYIESSRIGGADFPIQNFYSGPVSYYLVFLKDQPE